MKNLFVPSSFFNKLYKGLPLLWQSQKVFYSPIEDQKANPVWGNLLLLFLIYAFQLLLHLTLHLTFTLCATFLAKGDLNHLDQILSGTFLVYPLQTALEALPLFILPLYYTKQRGLALATLGLKREKKGWKKSLLGLCLGVSLLFLTQILIYSCGKTEFFPLFFAGSKGGKILFSLFTLALCALGEEVVFRGFLLSHFASKLHFIKALFLQAALFALTHLLNPYFSPIALGNTFLFALLLGCAAKAWKNLWPCVFLHFGWNAATMHLCGGRLSGLSPYGSSLFSFVNMEVQSNLTGGSYGVEGSFLCSLVLFFCLLFFIFVLCRQEFSK